MQKIIISERESYTYASGWNHLDSWKELGTAKMLQARMTREPNGYDDGARCVVCFCFCLLFKLFIRNIIFF